MKKELITLHIGQCGVQSGTTFWEQLAYEHDISPDGFSQIQGVDPESLVEPFAFFNITRENRYVPRTLFIDAEPTTIEEAKNGLYRSLFNPLSFIHGKEEAANNYARGRFILGGELHDPIVERIRQELEATDNCQGFVVNHSIGGGTGSGLTVRIMQHISNAYSKAIAVQVPIFPSEYLSTAVVDPYNAVLHCGFNMPYSNLVVMMDNAAIMGLLSRHLQIEKPTFIYLNRLISQIQSCLFCGFHYNADPICSTLEEVTTNLVPFPSLHFTYLRYAPIVGARRQDFQTTVHPAEELTKAVLSPQYTTLSADKFSRSKIIATCLSFRGAAAGWQRGLAATLLHSKMKQALNFVDWCPTGVKVAIHAVPPLRPVPESCLAECPANLTMLINGTAAVQRALHNINAQFLRLYERRCFVHWYVGEGMEEGEFTEASDVITDIISEYKNAEMPQE